MSLGKTTLKQMDYIFCLGSAIKESHSQMCSGSCHTPNVEKHFRAFDCVWQNHCLDCAPLMLDKGNQTTYDDPSLKGATVTLPFCGRGIMAPFVNGNISMEV